ncbi:unnamed protein product [Choristocarpus tenellus]
MKSEQPASREVLDEKNGHEPDLWSKAAIVFTDPSWVTGEGELPSNPKFHGVGAPGNLQRLLNDLNYIQPAARWRSVFVKEDGSVDFEGVAMKLRLWWKDIFKEYRIAKSVGDKSREHKGHFFEFCNGKLSSQLLYDWFEFRAGENGPVQAFSTLVLGREAGRLSTITDLSDDMDVANTWSSSIERSAGSTSDFTPTRVNTKKGRRARRLRKSRDDDISGALQCLRESTKSIMESWVEHTSPDLKTLCSQVEGFTNKVIELESLGDDMLPSQTYVLDMYRRALAKAKASVEKSLLP